MTQVNQAAMASMLFSKIREAKNLNSTSYLRGGHYWLKIDKCKIEQAAVTPFLPFPVIELTVVRVIDDNGGKGHRLGEAVARVVKNTMYIASECKAFAAVATGMEQDQIGQEEATSIFTENPLAGYVIEAKPAEVLKKGRVLTGDPTKDKDAQFTKPGYVRNVPMAEVLAWFQQNAPDKIPVYWPGDWLQRVAASEVPKAA